jgi:hypothetical protein
MASRRSDKFRHEAVRSESVKRTYIITAMRMISGDVYEPDSKLYAR